MAFEYAKPIKELFPYIQMQDRLTGEEFYIDWNADIAKMIIVMNEDRLNRN